MGATSTATPGGLPPTVSLALDQVPPSEVFRALGAALGVAVLIEGPVDRPPASVKFTNMDTKVALDLLCKNAGCTWEFDAARELRVRFNARTFTESPRHPNVSLERANSQRARSPFEDTRPPSPARPRSRQGTARPRAGITLPVGLD